MAFELIDLFPDQDYRFHLTLRRGDLSAFFATQDPAALAERRRWLSEDPSRYALGTPDSADLIDEFECTVDTWRQNRGPALSPSAPVEVPARLQRLGTALEPDFLLLAKDPLGEFRLRAGVVCFPSWWALAEKIGLTLDRIHGVVPELNPSLGPTIGQFLAKLKPGAPYERSNWGLAATPELNLHPALGRPRLSTPLSLERTFLRIEDQILATLPETGGILFGIALRVIPLRNVLDNPAIRPGFHRAVRTMPAPLVAYKGLGSILPELMAASAR